MTPSMLAVALLAILVVAYLTLPIVAYVRMRGTRVVVCPETMEPAATKVDAGHAAVTAVLNTPDIRLEACSRWPERAQCNQACVSQIRTEPRETLASQRVRQWLVDKTCAMCGRPFDPWQSVGPQPGLLNVRTLKAVRWDDVPAERLPVLFETHQPICKHCQLFEDFRRQFPDRVLDRHRMN